LVLERRRDGAGQDTHPVSQSRRGGLVIHPSQGRVEKPVSGKSNWMYPACFLRCGRQADYYH
jgi:hypothetical protein